MYVRTQNDAIGSISKPLEFDGFAICKRHMSIFAYIAIAAAIFLAGAAGGWKAHVGITASRDLEAELTRQRDVLRKTEKIDTSAVQHEIAKTRIETEFVTITKEVERVVEKPTYRNICLDDDGLRVIAAAIGAASTPSLAASTVPRPSPAD